LAKTSNFLKSKLVFTQAHLGSNPIVPAFGWWFVTIYQHSCQYLFCWRATFETRKCTSCYNKVLNPLEWGRAASNLGLNLRK
jgi:hypothetical protein